MYLLFPHHPAEAWMDPREQALIIKYLQIFNQTTNTRSAIMLEYGAGSSTFVYSVYVHRYVSIEHNLDYCRILERMATSQPNRSITISYMESNLSGFVERNRFEQNRPQSNSIPSIQIYCIVPTYSTLFHRFWASRKRSTYSMYQNYVDFISTYLDNQLFDFVLIDGRARPQAAYVVLKHLNGLDAKVFVHDWNERSAYHVIKNEFYDIIDQQIESEQIGGGGLVVLKRKPGITGKAKIDEIQWTNGERPSWWL
ncbi:unnamed protein product [Rotaria sp. Silwood2]|nr:unnamed protein product [Rotaria sp. Silwood2]CAF2781366.1 unnamed protein product [Rotaria sp. Silwood2]CAF3085879.1 unnamed protein product [Rotaria sp. Silwood2]CAF3329029.1 unnamed protein product [Rotaria sp. Silwood2]CAF4033410.1 unnamed protein product [Rotaria sp. Silwood2]